MTWRDARDLLVLSAVWGASFLFMRVAAPEFGPLALIEIRVVTALAFLLPFFLARGSATQLRRHWKPIATIGVLNSALPFCLLAWATLSLTGGFVAIVNSTTPLFGALIGWLWLDERLRPPQVAGLAIGFAGVFVLLGDSAAARGPVLPGILATAGASLLYGLGANIARRWLGSAAPLTVATGSMVSASLVLLPVALVTWPAEPVSPQAWLAVIVMGVVSTGIPYLLFFRLLGRIGPARALTVTYLVPIFAMLWGSLFLAEPVTPTMLAGCAVILAGITLAAGLVGQAAGTPAEPARRRRRARSRP